MTVTSAPGVKASLYATAVTLFAEDESVQVMYGITSPTSGRDGVAIGNITTDVTRPVMGRSRQEDHEIDVRSSVLIPDPDGQREATERAYELIDRLAEYYRTSPTTMSGIPARSDSYISSYALDEQPDNRELKKAGRYASVVAVFTVTVRI